MGIHCFQLFVTINSIARNTSGPGAYGVLLFQYDTDGEAWLGPFNTLLQDAI